MWYCFLKYNLCINGFVREDDVNLKVVVCVILKFVVMFKGYYDCFVVINL